ncbi:MAG: hypothetical protein ACP5OP_07475 [Leptospirillia bacterium]
MKIPSFLRALVAPAILALSLTACAHTTGSTPGNNIFAQAPAWVRQGGHGSLDLKGRAVFYGVGASQGVQNIPLAIEDANLRARAAIAAEFDTYISRLSRDYQRSLGAAKGLEQNDESQGIEVPLEGFTRMEVKGSTIVDHWQDPKTGTIFALAQIDLKQYAKDLQGYHQMDEEQKQSILKDMNHAFEELHKREAQKN